MRGRFITLEGGEGVGKSTQARALAAALEARGIAVVLTREPGGSAGAEAIRGLLLSGEADRWSTRAEALLFAAARADHIEKTIRPALEAGRWVICDRFLDSSRAYQSATGEMADEDILALHRIGSAGLLPDRTLLLAMSDEQGALRARARDGDAQDRIGGRDAAFHAQVGAAFEHFARAEPERFRRVDASGAPAEVTGRLDGGFERSAAMTQWRGHDRQIAELIAAPDAGRMHHGWIFAGPQGVGKAGIALDFAKRLLVLGAGRSVSADRLAPPDSDQAVKFLDAGAHPDFVLLQRLEKDDKKSESGTLARNISVDQVRSLSRLLNNAPSMGTRRVILIDSADDLETGAANALLKNLEEPPAGAIFLLIAHAPGRLLPTIRSRCRMLRFQPLDDESMALALADAAPDLSAADRAALARSAQGSPGQALAIRALDLPGMERALDLIAAGDRQAEAERSRLVQALSSVSARPRLEAFADLVPRFIAQRTREAKGRALSAGLSAYDEARRISAGAITPLQLEPGALVHRLCDTIAKLQ